MSMLSAQADELREAASRLDEIGISMGHDTTASAFIAHDVSERMRSAADTITSLRNRLQELQSEVNHWRTEQVHAYGNWEDAYKRVIELEANNGTRWHELFGTPERAARTMIDKQLTYDVLDQCDECPHQTDECFEPSGKCAMQEHDALLEWLRGDAE